MRLENQAAAQTRRIFEYFRRSLDFILRSIRNDREEGADFKPLCHTARSTLSKDLHVLSVPSGREEARPEMVSQLRRGYFREEGGCHAGST